MVKVFQDVAWTICWVLSGEFSSYEDLTYKTNFGWEKARWYKNFLIPIICLFPLLIRFNQCLRRYIDTGDRFPHLPNAAKYALSQTVTLFGAFHPLYMELDSQIGSGGLKLFQLFWMLVFVSSSLYSFTWDVFMDWGLGKPSYGYLGPSLMYPRRSYYYATMAIDLGEKHCRLKSCFFHLNVCSQKLLCTNSSEIHVGFDSYSPIVGCEI
jgi:hypothetical protein